MGSLPRLCSRCPAHPPFSLAGAVVYTRAARAGLLGIDDADMAGLRPANEAYSLLIARRIAERHAATWGIGETGAAGPTGNRYGDPAGHTCIAIAGLTERAVTLRTGRPIWMFSQRALQLLAETILAKP